MARSTPTAEALRLVLEQESRRASLTAQQVRLLAVLSAAGAAEPPELMEAMGASPSQLSRLARGLVEQGYVVRVADDPHDGRKCRFVITTAGRSLNGRIDALLTAARRPYANHTEDTAA